MIICGSACSHKLATFQPSYDKKDSIVIRQVPVWRDTIITLPGDSIHIVDTLACPEISYHKEAAKGNLKAVVNFHGGVLQVDCKADSLNQRIRLLEYQLQTEKFSKEVKTVPVEVKVPAPYLPAWAKWITGIALLVLAYTFRSPLLSLVKWTIARV